MGEISGPQREMVGNLIGQSSDLERQARLVGKVSEAAEPAEANPRFSEALELEIADMDRLLGEHQIDVGSQVWRRVRDAAWGEGITDDSSLGKYKAYTEKQIEIIRAKHGEKNE